MNTYTSTSTYTSPLQSVALGKFLPLESADMCYKCIEDDPYDIVCKPYSEWKEEYKGLLVRGDAKVIPCWSLAALLNALPKNLNIGRPSLESNYKGYYWIQYYDEFMKPNNYKTECFNNPVDACYELILKLHELKML